MRLLEFLLHACGACDGALTAIYLWKNTCYEVEFIATVNDVVGIRCRPFFIC